MTEIFPKIHDIFDTHPKILNQHYKRSVMTLKQMAEHFNVSYQWLENKIKFGESFE